MLIKIEVAVSCDISELGQFLFGVVCPLGPYTTLDVVVFAEWDLSVVQGEVLSLRCLQ